MVRSCAEGLGWVGWRGLHDGAVCIDDEDGETTATIDGSSGGHIEGIMSVSRVTHHMELPELDPIFAGQITLGYRARANV